MSTFALIHGAGVGGGWFWHLVEAELRSLGHTTVAPTLWNGDETETLDGYADKVIDLIDTQDELFVVAHSFGGFTAPLIAERIPTAGLIYVTAMVPWPGESPDEWWTNTGFHEAVRIQAAKDGGLTGGVGETSGDQVAAGPRVERARRRSARRLPASSLRRRAARPASGAGHPLDVRRRRRRSAPRRTAGR